MSEYKYTMDELRKAYRQQFKRDKKEANSPLWIIASRETSEILNKNSRDDAIKELRKLRKKYRNMALSITYQSAINELLKKRERLRA